MNKPENKKDTMSGNILKKGDYKTKLKKAAFRCLRCDHLTIVDQEIDSGEVITPFECENDACGRHGPFKLVVEKSSFIED